MSKRKIKKGKTSSRSDKEFLETLKKVSKSKPEDLLERSLSCLCDEEKKVARLLLNGKEVEEIMEELNLDIGELTQTIFNTYKKLQEKGEIK